MKHKSPNSELRTPNSIYAVILAGGPGERFWPASRARRPKYVTSIVGAGTMIEQTAGRLKGLVANRNVLIVTTKDQVRTLKKVLSSGAGDVKFLVEPCCRDTAAAIGLAAVYLRKKNPDAIMAVLPADHYIRNTKRFHETMKNAVKAAQMGYLVTLGIKPAFASTGYGYIKTRNRKPETGNRKSYYVVDKFVEKPDKKKAEMFLRRGGYFWNAGMFVWKTEVIIQHIKSFMPKLYRSLLKIEKLLGSPGFERRIGPIYSRLDKVSIDYGIMEKSSGIALVPATFDWTDCGSWLSLEEVLGKDRCGNVRKGLSVACDTKNSIVVSSGDHLIATSGVKDLVIVHTADATLVVNKADAQKLKGLVGLIRESGFSNYL